MQYIWLVYQEEPNLTELSQDELDTVVGECIAYIGELQASGHHVFSSGLQSVRTATTLRRRNGNLSVTDGPFAETKEFLGGFTIVEARDLNGAIQLASKMPTGRFGSIEVRPVMDPFQELTDPVDRMLCSSIRRAMQTAANCDDAVPHFNEVTR